MHVIQPESGWEVPVHSQDLIATALVMSSPAALAAGPPRLNGSPDEVVAERHAQLVADVRGRMPDLTGEIDDGIDAWRTRLLRAGVDDDPEVVASARRVWQALGPNEYAVHFQGRPRTYRGFLEGRMWLDVGVLGLLAIGVLAWQVQQRWGIPWWSCLPLVVVWPVALAMRFTRWVDRRARRGGRELPHL